jgi:DNA-binding beta-propeller fold protein YncE
MKTFPNWLLCTSLVSLFLTTLGNPAQAKDIAIVSMTGSGEVAFIDIKKGKVTKSVKLLDGASLPAGIAITPDQSTVVVASRTGYISFLDVEEKSVLKTLTLLSGPEKAGITLIPNEFNRVAITPDGSTAVVTEGNEWGQLFVVNLETMELVRGDIFIGDSPNTIIINSDTAYVLDGTNMHVLTNVSANTFPIPDFDAGDDFALTADGTQAIVLGGGSFYLMDTSTWSTIYELSVDENVYGEVTGRQVAVSPDETLAIVTSGTEPSIIFVSILGSSSLEILEVLEIGGTANGVAFTQDGQTAVVTLSEASMIKIIDVPTRQVRATVSGKLGLVPTDVVIVDVDF